MAQKNILLVDDDEFILGLLESALKDHPDYKTTTAKNGQEALKKQSNEHFDLIITDIIMPGKDGIQLIDDLRKSNINTPVIAISGGNNQADNDAGDYIDFARYFANETLAKPFSKEDLLSTIALVLSNKNSDFMQYL